MIDRSISFEGVPNCRTLGGLPAAGGSRVADGRLFRSALLAAATPEDLRRLHEELGVTLVVDLRTSWEREEKPDREVPGAAFLARPVFDDPKPGVSHEEKLEQGPPPIPDMADVYRLMVSEEKCRANLGAAVREIMEHVIGRRGAALWHCTEGKDRCGLVSAMLLTALGAERSLIREDYLLTNRVNGPKSEKIRAELLAAGKTAEEADHVRDLVLAKEEYFDAAFEIVDRDFGGAETYLREGLAIPEATIRAFRDAALTE